MSSFFTDDEKDEIESIFDDLHDTFKREVYVYSEIIEEESFSSNDFNAHYGRAKDQAKPAVTVKKDTISARVHYERWNPENTLEINLPSSELIIRLKVDRAGYELIKNSIFVEVDQERYSLVSDSSVIDPFTENYYRIYLRRDS